MQITGLKNAQNLTVTETGNERAPYEVTGPRGIHYGLMRNANNPSHLFAVNLRSMGSLGNIRGFEWFVEDGDEIKAFA